MKRLLLGGLTIGLICLAAAMAYALRHPELAPVEAQAAPDADLVERGELLASVGGCASCHGEDLSGGHALPTPFGTIHSTNITPDPQTGIGLWSAEAFMRAMRKGVDREGRHLYPAFPFDNFTHASDADLSALYAYLMAQPAVARPAQENDLRFPFNIRLLLAGWKALFLDEGPLPEDPARNAEWNRGAYLAEGLAHCSACHSGRNALGARDPGRAYAGGFAEGWWSPALNTDTTAPMTWTQEELINYLYDGWEENHGIAAGPMKQVVANVSLLPEDDVAALAAYIGGHMAQPDEDARVAARARAEDLAVDAAAPPTPEDGAAMQNGADVFMAKCANCHRAGSETVPLALATAVTGPAPNNFLRIVRQGVSPSENAYFVRPMPGFPDMTDTDLADLAGFVRQRFAGRPAWAGIDAAIAEMAPP